MSKVLEHVLTKPATVAGRQPWIYSPLVDGIFILSPPLLATMFIVSCPGLFSSASDIPIWAWVLLIVAVDVAHVYSTLFRTYFDSDELRKHTALYTLIPLLGWLGGVMLYSMGSLVFWRILAYLAVFHFVRQQYGFMMIYRRKEKGAFSGFQWIDKATIYMATIYPLVYWHTHLPRNFSWFIQGDFFRIQSKFLDHATFLIYATCLFAYATAESLLTFRSGKFNLPKNLLVVGTVVSWYVGIICFNGDLAFTLTNVISHGVPYMCLIWIYGHNKSALKPREKLLPFLKARTFFSAAGVPLFIGVLFLLAYFEEGLWDGFVWRDHTEVFQWFSNLPRLVSQSTLAWMVPLLALPQITHYILDGFIWRIRGGDTEWKNIVFNPQR